MTNPSWVNDLFATVMVVVAGYSAGRLVAARRWSRPLHRDIEVAHILMGVSMTSQLVSALNPISSAVWELVFSLLAAWFIWRCYQFVKEPSTATGYGPHVHQLSRRLIHLVMSLAMLYMYLAAVPSAVGRGGSMAMGAATGATTDFVILPLAFIVALFASAIWEVDRIGRLSPSHVSDSQPALTFASVGSTPVASEIRASAEGSPETARDVWLAPRLEAGAHIAMCLTMGYMLILML